jgi:cell division protein FtsB
MLSSCPHEDFRCHTRLGLVLLQYRLWVSDQGLREVSRLQRGRGAQTAANVEQRERNRQLVAEVNDLKVA